MAKRFGYPIVFLLGALLSIGFVTISRTRWAAQADSSTAKSPTGFPLMGPTLAGTVPPVLTRDDLVTRGHADDKLEIASLFYTYIWYHDSHNGPGVASLFTDDGILETLWNNAGKTVEPNAGPHGKGCLEYGHKQIADMFGYTPLPWVGHSHNQVSNVNVQVRGEAGTLYANWTTIRSNDHDTLAPGVVAPNTAVVSHNGEYVGDAKLTPEGWRFLHLRVLEDEPAKFGTQVCEDNVAGKQGN